MLSRLSVRTKLLAILVPPLLGLTVIAGFGVQARLDQRDAATRTVTISRTVQSADAYVNELQRERLIAVGSRLGETAVTQAQLEEQIKVSDDAGRVLSTQLDALSELDNTSVRSFGPAGAADRYRTQLAGIGDLRTMNLETTVDLRTIADRYSALIESMLETSSELFLGADELPASAQASHWLAESKEAGARSAALGSIVLNSAPAGTAWIPAELGRLGQRSDSLTAVFLNDTDPVGRSAYVAAKQSPGYVASVIPFTRLGDLDPGRSLNETLPTPLSMKDWVEVASGRFDSLAAAETEIVQAEVLRAESVQADVERSLRVFLGGAILALVLALALAATVARSLSKSLRLLSNAARKITTEQLPILVESMRSPEAAAQLEVREIELRSRDELGDLAESFNLLQRGAVEVAASQAQALRKGISDIFVNLARRNQTLLDRQIEFIDRLEANEEDPDQLEHLFRLDHLATRMRRNAESLLVLAGAEPPRRRAREVALTDVVRVAVGEVEDFSRVNLLAVDESTVIGGSAVDIAHLLSELMENGAQYSPPDRMVEVVGHRLTDGGYVVSVSDHGVGMSADQLADANQLLAQPPVIGLSLSRSLGFVVASTLAARHGIQIKLVHGPTGGVTAHVMLPAAVIVNDSRRALGNGSDASDASDAGTGVLSGQSGVGFVPMTKAQLGRGPIPVSRADDPAEVAAAEHTPFVVEGPEQIDVAASTWAETPQSFTAPNAFSTPEPVLNGWSADGEYIQPVTAADLDPNVLPQRRGTPMFDLGQSRPSASGATDVSDAASAPAEPESAEPAELVESDAASAPAEPESAEPAVLVESDGEPAPAEPVEAPVLDQVAEELPVFDPVAEPFIDRPEQLEEAVPMGVAFEQGLFSLLAASPTPRSPDGSDLSAGTPGAGGPDGDDGIAAALAALPPLPPRSSAPVPPPPSPNAPSVPAYESSTMLQEQMLQEQLHVDHRRGDLPQRQRGRNDFSAVPAESRIAAPVRPPQEVRHLLSRYRAGLSTGRASTSDHVADGIHAGSAGPRSADAATPVDHSGHSDHPDHPETTGEPTS